MREMIFLLLTAGSALLAAGSLPSFDVSFLAWLALAPFLYSLRQKGLIGGAVFGFVFGCVYGAGTFSWLPAVEGVSPWRFVFLVLPTFSSFYLAFGLFYSLINRYFRYWIFLVGPAIWVAMEYVRANFFFLSLPWNFIGHSQHRFLTLIQISDIIGMYGISFIIVLVNQFLSQLIEPFVFKRKTLSRFDSNGAIKSNWAVSLIAIMVVLAVTIFYGRQSLNEARGEGQFRVALIQPNVLTFDNMTFAEQKEHLQTYYRLSLEAAGKKPDLIVWPASSLPASIKASRLVRSNVLRLARKAESYLLVGGSGQEKFGPQKDENMPNANSEFLIGPKGSIAGQYHKMKLVPFNEFLPLGEIITWPHWLTTLSKSFIPGDEYTLFEVSKAKFGTPICWESMYPDLFRRFVKNGANFMVNVTNEGFYGRTSAPYQTLAMTVFRAVENRVTVARCGPTGISAFIDPYGNIVQRIQNDKGDDLFVSGVLVRDVSLSKGKTFYTEYGDIFAYFCLGLSALGVIGALWVIVMPQYIFGR